MSTHSTIAILKADKTVESIYCHSDGYLGYNGICLFTYHQEPENAKDLISLGNLSSLNKLIHPTTNTHSFSSREENVSTFYGRDRIEDKQESEKFNSLKEFVSHSADEEYVYLYKEQNNKWYLFDRKNQKFKSLKTALSKIKDTQIYYKFKDDYLNLLQITKNYKNLNKDIPIKNPNELSLTSTKYKI